MLSHNVSLAGQSVASMSSRRAQAAASSSRWAASLSQRRLPLAPTAKRAIAASSYTCITGASRYCSSTRLFSTSLCRGSSSPTPISAIRNISAWGHIDAGKTTLTERLLYHTGGSLSSSETSTRSPSLPGDVDAGSTVTDFLEQERERGITIQSAAVGPLWWKSPATQQSGAITLVDTPGHIDFTIEVERALRVADGCIVVMDSVEGVEAQTETNWRIGKRYGVRSNLLFLNKLDRMGASVAKSLRSFVQKGLHSRPVLLQLPLFARSEGVADEGRVEGVVDLVEMKEIRFEGRAGEELITKELSEPASIGESTRARHALVETIASLDEKLMEELFSIDGDNPHAKISAPSLRASIRRLTIAGKVVPTFCGSAAKNIGVQPLLDGVVDYLPAPNEAGDVRDEFGMGDGTVEGKSMAMLSSSRSSGKGGKTSPAPVKASPSRSAASKSSTAAASQDGPRGADELNEGDDLSTTLVSINSPSLTCLAFKVVYDKRRGPLTFVRVYSGQITRSTTLFNTSTQTKERLSRILLPFGGTYNEVDRIGPGQVGVVLGLRDTKTGDTLVESGSGSGSKTRDDLQSLRLRTVDVPPPVFSVSVEPHSKSDEDSVNEALAMLVRTDPSLRLDGGEHGSKEEGFGSAGTDNQMILSGMGELHLEIAKDRLKNEFGVKARIGSVRVSYRETLAGSDSAQEEWSTVEETVERDMGGKKVKVGAKIRIRSLPEGVEGDAALGGNLIKVDLARGGGDEDVLGTHESKSALKRKEKETGRRQGHHPSNRSGAAIQEHEEGSGSGQETSSSSAAAAGLSPQALHAHILSGLTASLSRGPLSSHPLTGLEVHLSSLQTFSSDLSPPRAISAIVGWLTRKALKEQGRVRMMEPVMRVKIECREGSLGRVVGDITSEQGGEVVEVVHETAAGHGGGEGEGEESEEVQIYLPPEPEQNGGTSSVAGAGAGAGIGNEGGASPSSTQKTSIEARIPLSKLVSYSSRLRALTAGAGTYTMALEGFRVVGEERQREILAELGRV
ncbi:P-loop containing nucleoside triphosphate hydrolase protein [Microstroma glucosiphilum]|uniref:P-loop containing nucleoside triphosphate hydrolase protein n=1 Tax=Pseudomicrostroma glucosiphilum TaxID=1684307 RepID=A0A316UHK3_9BASI|nr:P-loop containing nucleoside triphosphate hydrolase protein [Pseudomicrostroma glucosiphilum]PWN23413.1 P-loop containing nucleoside triphosphate hydrolase protein [Pseudomicrostroma glucosiphilum]